MSKLLLDQQWQADSWLLDVSGNLTSACDEGVQKNFVGRALPQTQSGEIPASTTLYSFSEHLL